jgi:hypothetical protein
VAESRECIVSDTVITASGSKNFQALCTFKISQVARKFNSRLMPNLSGAYQLGGIFGSDHAGRDWMILSECAGETKVTAPE